MTLSLSPQDAWQPLPAGDWNAEAARHLLRRAGWTARPAEVQRAAQEGLALTLDRLFPPSPALLPEPEMTQRVEDDMPEFAAQYMQAAPEDKRVLGRQQRERWQAAYLDLSIRWLDFAAQPENSAYQKWVLFLSDVYVVGFEKVRRTPLIYRHFDLLARHGLGPAPALSKAVSRSPAMVLYLDLAENRREAPNENFARELLELFLLGEGNYTERDIKEAARAFTGYRIRPPGDFVFAPRQHDPGLKTVFGHTGHLTGDDVIDLAYDLPAAGAYLPRKLTRFYLSDEMLPDPYLYALGGAWQASGYDLRWLARAFFGSRLFFAPEFRGNFIKSPVQFYLALLQDLDLDGVPLPRYVINPMRQMGQVLFNPPNVRGWVGGRNWINSGSLAARRTLVESVFHPLNPESLNADELRELAAAAAARRGDFAVADERFGPLVALGPGAAVRAMAGDFLPVPAGPSFQGSLETFIAGGRADPREHLRRVRRTLITILESPAYQLC